MDTGPEPFSEDLPPQSTSGDTYGETGGRAANRGWRRRRTGREPAEQQAQADRFPPWGQERGLRYYPDAGVAPIEVRDLLEYEPFSRFFTRVRASWWAAPRTLMSTAPGTSRASM